MNTREHNSKPMVSVGIPTLNRVDYLRIAIDSVLQQTYNNIEVVISNNCSIDGSSDYLASIRDPRVKILTQHSQLSMVDNWNACVTASSGEYFLLLSDDDVLLPTAIEELTAGYELRRHEAEQPGIVYCSGEVIDSAGKFLWNVTPSPERESAKELILSSFRGKRNVLLCSVLFRRTDIGEGFPTGLKIVNDSALWMSTVICYGYAIHIPKKLILYRIHNKNLSYATPARVWVDEMTRLAALVLKNMAHKGASFESFAKQMDEAIQSNNQSHAPLWIKRLLGRRLSASLREFVHRVKR